MSLNPASSLAPRREPTAAGVAGLTALELFRRRVAAGPARPLIHARGVTLTAADVDGLSRRVACALEQRGVEPGDRVGLLLQNDPQFPIAQLAAWRIGAISVPLNPMLRTRELEAQLGDSGCKVLICLDELAEAAIPAALAVGVEHIAVTSADELAGVRPVRVASPAERFEDWLDTSAGDSRPVACSPDDLAVITFTSGTTGRAKGACLSHANIVWAAHVFRDWADLDADTVILGAAPLFHVTGQVAYLALGDLLAAPLILDHRFEPRSQLAAARRHDATFLVAAVTAFQALLAVSDRAPASFTRLVSGAQAVPPALIAEVEAWSGCYLQNIYGMTETTSPCHAVPPGMRAPIDPASGALSVGVPVTATESIVADQDTGAPLPAGQRGEILVRGPQVVSGYWRRPDADAEAFRDGWLRTGDLGVVDEDGWFYVVDRIKDIINASGYKVAPREVEEAIQSHPAVRAAAVVGVSDQYRGETVKAFVQLREGFSLDPDEIVEHCQPLLAAYKRPRIVEFVDELPMTASGKVMRRELRAEKAPEPAPPAPSSSPPQND